jgi:hypothetical protein
MSFPELPNPGFSASWFGFEPCCGGNIIYFRHDGTTNAPEQGISEYTGPTAQGYDPIDDVYVALINQCYRIFRGEATDPSSPINGINYSSLNVVPSYTPSNYNWDSTTTYETPCGDQTPGFCPVCPTQCYTLYPCDESGVAVTTDTDLSAYVGQSIFIKIDQGVDFRCYFVTLALDCINAITVDTNDQFCNCNTCYCREVIGNTFLDYVDCDGNPVSIYVNGYWKGCVRTYPIIDETNAQLILYKECIEGQCPPQCYRLNDCNGLLESIFATLESLSPYAVLGQIVQIEGYDTCWTVENTEEIRQCSCAINVSVVQVYDTCDECNPAPNYKLVNCDDPTTIVYTSSDLSAYVGQAIIRAECKGCWTVYEVNGPIPSDVLITVETVFDDCKACKTRFYRLKDCAEIEANIFTSTDLSDYVDRIIVLEWCPTTCWLVEAAETSTDAGVLGNILGDFNDCTACLRSFPCVCSRIKNHDIVTLDYKYLDCDGAVQAITLAPGERSERICIAHWYSSYSTDYVEYFGDCINRVECPPQIYPKRKITPGYKTPICSTEKYEKITCKSAEILYKQVLTLRYGISNCCPDEDNKWLVRKELIDLQALKDPDYTCEVTSCGCNNSPCSCNHSSCGCGQTSCGCNTNLRACNSQ